MSESCPDPSAAMLAEAPPRSLHIALLTAAAMIAFAANSLLCRLALQRAAIDPASFSSIRLLSGALMLSLLLRVSSSRGTPRQADWPASVMLFGYVACFSYAYLTLGAGTGALILFGAVQLTMFVAGLAAGERFTLPGWAGFALAAAGLVYLVSPGVTAPAPLGAALMAAGGVAWGGYSLRGRGKADPLAASAGNFLRATPLALALSLFGWSHAHVSATGMVLAVLSGAVTSGIGYVIWYAALKGLTALRAATVQLSVPPLAAISGALLLAEPITPRLAVCSAVILGGIALVLVQRARR